MEIKTLIAQHQHRPWPMPESKWHYYQEWNQVVFLHWAVSPAVLEPMMPEGLKLDIIDGQAWVSLVAFTMNNIRPRNLPAFSPVSDFDEINIRTYVERDGKTGVHFLSIEAGKPIAVKIARSLSGLPYRYSKMSRNEEHFTSINKERGDHLEITGAFGNAMNSPDQLDLWLTERYALIQDDGHALNQFEIHHVPWPLYVFVPDRIRIDYPEYDFLSDPPHRVHYSPGVQVVSWGKVRV